MDMLNAVESGIQELEKRADALADESPGEHPLVTQYRDTVRKGELGGIGLGALGGLGLGLLGRKALGHGAMLPILGTAVGGLGGKLLGRMGGEEYGVKQLSDATGLPWDV